MRTSFGSALEPMKRFFSRSAPPVHTASTRRHSSFGMANGGVENWENRGESKSESESESERGSAWNGMETDYDIRSNHIRSDHIRSYHIRSGHIINSL